LSSPAAEDDDLGVDGPEFDGDEDYHCELRSRRRRLKRRRRRLKNQRAEVAPASTQTHAAVEAAPSITAGIAAVSAGS
jgi:hypothetical protein